MRAIKNILKRVFPKYFYWQLPKGLFLINFIVQRIFRLNSRCNFQVHFTSKVNCTKDNILFNRYDPKSAVSFAVSGGCYFNIFPGTTLTIGDQTIWAANVSILTGNHGLLDRNKYEYKSVAIGRNCWLGTGVTILPGVTLGDNVTVGANSVVTKSFPSNLVIGGCPARIIKELQPETLLH